MNEVEAIEETSPLPSLPVRAAQVIFTPGALFQALKARPVWFWTAVILSVLTGMTVWFIPEEAWTNLFREQMLASGRVTEDGLPPVGTGFRVMSTAAATVSLLLLQIILASFTFGVFVFLLGDEGTFKQHLAVVAHAGVLPTLGAFVALPLRIAQLDPELTLSVGTLFFFLPDGYLLGVLQALDLFALWAAVLTGLGLSVLDPERSWLSGSSVLVGLTVVFALVVGSFR